MTQAPHSLPPKHEIHSHEMLYHSHNSIKPRETRAGFETKHFLGNKYYDILDGFYFLTWSVTMSRLNHFLIRHF